MTKKFKSLGATGIELKRIVSDPGNRFLSILSEEHLKDSNKLAPKQDGFLRNSAVISSLFNQGRLLWTAVYSAVRYFTGSITGVKKWAEVNTNRNINKYKKMIITYINKRK
jgi:hypothetical protein